MLTAGESAGIASLAVIGIKAAFGRRRPREDHHDHDAFFYGGSSFVAGEETPLFALAAGIGEYSGNRSCVDLPVYSLALTDGFGRMGHDAHWFSDVIGAALVGVGTTELLLYMHHYHEEHPWRLRISRRWRQRVNCALRLRSCHPRTGRVKHQLAARIRRQAFEAGPFEPPSKTIRTV